MRVLSYVVGQVLNVAELFQVWGSILSSGGLQPEKTLDKIGQKLYASKNTAP
ncbi:MAG: hypothetical protein HXS48_03380 [Theionarchaea archaeon]|nr:hypothetical protein [Theionarchaea archaeon]